jgi:signal transduction histidine kinase
MSTKHWRDLAAVGIALLAFALALVPLTLRQYETGIHLAVDASTNRLVVASVEPYSQGALDGIQPGMIVVWVNGTQLIDLPQELFGDPGPVGPEPPVPVIGIQPTVPTNLLGAEALASLANTPIHDMAVLLPADLASGSASTGWNTLNVYYPGFDGLYDTGIALVAGLAVLIVGGWWLVSGRAGSSLATLGFPLAAATATPIIVLPLAASGAPAAYGIAGLLSIAAMLPLALALTSRVEGALDRRFAILSIVLCTVAATVVSVGAVLDVYHREVLAGLRVAFTAAIPIVPGLIAAGPVGMRAASGAGGAAVTGRGPGGLLRSTELALAGATPLFALLSGGRFFVWPLVVWLLAIYAAGRFTVRPLARLATRATLQRDLVVAATEAERARVAADIHDDALQELTLLVRRLEASGDTEGAEIGRTVADKLRAICGDLRLPILDDLGVGPALDWLVLRIERLAGGEVRLERSEDARHAPEVELAIFRVAQEALANAVKHGQAPIVVRYRSTEGGISLAIDDAGPGIPDDAPATAEQAGRFGLLNMSQRAEQIGAILDVKRWPGGGTHVALEWRPR